MKQRGFLKSTGPFLRGAAHDLNEFQNRRSRGSTLLDDPQRIPRITETQPHSNGFISPQKPRKPNPKSPPSNPISSRVEYSDRVWGFTFGTEGSKSALPDRRPGEESSSHAKCQASKDLETRCKAADTS